MASNFRFFKISRCSFFHKYANSSKINRILKHLKTQQRLVHFDVALLNVQESIWFDLGLEIPGDVLEIVSVLFALVDFVGVKIVNHFFGVRIYLGGSMG